MSITTKMRGYPVQEWVNKYFGSDTFCQLKIYNNCYINIR